MLTTLSYHWHHHPTGHQGLHTATFPFPLESSRRQLLALIDQWNAQQPDRWTYWL